MLELNLVSKKVIFYGKSEKSNILVVSDNFIKLLPKKNIPILNLPVKLPMISPPKKYIVFYNNSSERKLGGYLLNDDLYVESLIIENSILVNKT